MMEGTPRESASDDASDPDRADVVVRRARAAATAWARSEWKERLPILRRFRRAVAQDALRVARASRSRSSEGVPEALVGEVLPLLDACRFLERNARRLLRPRRLGRKGRPLWLWGVRLEVHREPLGVVLVIAASNYPLFLPGVQALQAIASGNAVVLKPGAGGRGAAELLRDELERAGLPSGVLQVLDESSTAARGAIDAGVDKVVLTGSASTGVSVLERLAKTIVPAVLELSGCDAIIVGPGADLDLVAKAAAFGLRWNGSETCIAPRRMLVPRDLAPELTRRIVAAIETIPPRALPYETARRLASLLEEARGRGARVVTGGSVEDESSRGAAGAERLWRATIVTDASPDMELLRSDLFAPILSIVSVADPEDLLPAVAACPFALGVSVFGEPRWARAFASEVFAGTVVVNDLIVPTADPRLPFGARGRSGFGVTRGAEGLLELTRIKAVAIRGGRSRPHLAAIEPGDEALFKAWIRATHGAGVFSRARAALSLGTGLVGKLRRQKSR